jgi:mRNA-degrading endonuclease RelE of RelBE toxin-antitoxin system
MDAWRVLFHPCVVSDVQKLTDCEFNAVLRALDQIAHRVNPCADLRVRPIHCTEDRWQRLKIMPQNLRVGIEVRYTKHQIIVLAVLKRSDETYTEIEMRFKEKELAR